MKIVFTIGDVNGIGFEVLIKALNRQPDFFNSNTFSIVANKDIIKYLIEKYNYNFCDYADDAIIINGDHLLRIEIVDIEKKNSLTDFQFGIINKEAGELAYHSIEIATKKTIMNEFDAMVTLPISKEAIHLTMNDFIGHTEFIAKICKVKTPLMILFKGKLKVALATTHIPLFRVNKVITKKKLQTLIRNFNISLKKDFLITNPKIAILGLNPHNGDNGMFGKEEQAVIVPTVEVMKRKFVNIEGPFPADGFFASKKYEKYDGIIAMYHDQGLIPLKMLMEDVGGVNFTANLPIVRTSPDHGVGFDIAGKNMANTDSMCSAISSAIQIAECR